MNKNSRYATENVINVIKNIEEICNEKSNEEKKKMSGADAKAFNAVRQKNKKTLGQYSHLINRGSELNTQINGTSSKIVADEAITPKIIEMIPENVLRKLQEVIGNRGRKHADKQENLNILRKLYELSANDRHKIQVMIGTVAAQFDMISNTLGYLPLEIWTSTIQDVEKTIVLMKDIDSLSIDEINREAEEFGLPGIISLQGSLLSFTQRLDDEFVKALQIIESNTTEYEDFIKSEKSLYSALTFAHDYFKSIGQTEYRCQILSRQLEHIYFRPEHVISHFGANNKTVATLCQDLYKNGTEKIKIRALLSHVYHLALHGQYILAREIFINSHVSEQLSYLDVSSQILYNRTVVQLGLAAFQRGLLKETYFSLQEICSSGRPRELLAQGLQSQKFTDRTPDQERADKQRQLPYHMHINVELIDSVFLTVSMLLEIPQAAAAARRFFKGERKIFTSRHLRRLIDGYDRNLFNGPPENTRDHIISAAKALANGNWKRCFDLILASELWTVFPSSADLKDMLQQKIKEASLCTFILAFGPTFSNLSIDYLAETFELNVKTIELLINKLVEDHDVPLVYSAPFFNWIQAVEISPLHELVLQIKDKLAVIQERNKECLEIA